MIEEDKVTPHLKVTLHPGPPGMVCGQCGALEEHWYAGPPALSKPEDKKPSRWLRVDGRSGDRLLMLADVRAVEMVKTANSPEHAQLVVLFKDGLSFRMLRGTTEECSALMAELEQKLNALG